MKHWLIRLCITLLLSNLTNAHAGDSKILYFYNWSEYVPAGLLEQFTRETGIKVIYSTYESNETLYARLKTCKECAYDLIVPSTYFISRMRNEQMLQRIDKSKLSNFHHLDANLLDKSFDPQNNYSVPYIWGATAIGVNKNVLDPHKITRWADLWKPEYKQQILMTDDAREVFQVALRKLGFSGNTTNEQEIMAAYQALKQLLPNILAFNSDNPAAPFIEGEVNVGMIWNGSAWIGRQEGVPIELVWPDEGAIFWMDSLAIPANAKNRDGALALINFLLRPDVAARVATLIGYPTPVATARALLPPHIANDPSLYPPAEIIAKGQWQDDAGKMNILYETLFQKLKAGD